MTSKFTMIITTYNKPTLLKRILSYYDNCNFENRIIVADTSTKENKKINKGIIDSCSNLDIFYLTNFPTINEFPGASGQFVKLADATDYVEDKYCVTCADDDFILPNGIKKSVEFLEKNKDFVVAHGQYLAFSILDEAFHWNYSPKTDSNTHSDPKSRLLQHFSNYTLTTYAVHRTEIMNKIWKETTQTKNLGVFGELTASMLTSIYGKMKGLDFFYDFRQADFTSHGRTAKKLYDYVAEGTYDEKYLRLKNCLSENLSKIAEISIKEAEKIVDKGWAEHTKRYKGFVSSK
ncbi:MAG: TIGR00180 family glycosyltransferase, partial [Thermoplasmatales archaeon]|nr:TIGR00180 family glycosyltransferase [Thermoplasmatales archaeon]